ncbi:putative protein related to capsule biosynthesis enzymes [Gammaproteobacteria bacterium MOLA455]|nr:putative protein related to capsule biosynthesis enzymes [Gammaproteobacteria bacterium MOLA455]
MADVQQFARRLPANILLANGDANLKSWSLIYPDRVTPRLSPAKDIVTSKASIENETKYAMNLAEKKAWDEVSMRNFKF